MTRYRKSASSATEGQKQEKVACSPAWFTVLIAGQKCATAPPTTLRSGKTILYVPATAATREPVQLTSSGRLYWKNWWMHMKTVISYVTRHEAHFRTVMEHRLRLSNEEAVRGYKKRLAQAERRLGELDRLFIRIYEDMAGKLSDERFTLMSKTYEDEQAQLKVEIQTLQQEIEVQERQIENLEQFIQRVHKYEDLQEMTPYYSLREIVKGIYIEAPDKSSGKRRQGIRISYDLVGFIPVDELMKQETA